MIIKTKKYQLDNKTYRKIALVNVFKKQWWLPTSIFLGIIVLNLLLNLVYYNTWIFYFAPISLLLYYLFWLIQFMGAPHLEQMKPMFQKLSYEISAKEILMKINTKQGMQMKWEMVKEVEMRKDAFILYFTKAQFIHLPFRIFTSENDIKRTELILKRKGLLK
ncbi:MAG: YcxB family protein [Microscillaceae bacterium]|nr:YcxB family protein [Microscillaceae bacterium]